MSGKKEKPVFTPCHEQIALWPEISGNEISGLGETEERPPSQIYWHDPKNTPHGKLQDWMMNEGIKEPALHGARQNRAKVIKRKMPPISENKVIRTPEENYQIVTKMSQEAGAKIVGVVKADPMWVFEGYDFDYPWIIMLGAEMDFEELSKAPEVEAAIAVVEGYTDGWRFSQPIAEWIRNQGWSAEPRGGPPAGPISLVPAALAAGFGELGKHGSIINRELGSNFRLGAVFTDLPLLEDKLDEFGADDFCKNCQICVNACPVDAITHAKQTVRGVEKWFINFDKCLPFFNENFGCAVCIAVCPWSKPGRAPLMAQKMTKRKMNKMLKPEELA